MAVRIIKRMKDGHVAQMRRGANQAGPGYVGLPMNFAYYNMPSLTQNFPGGQGSEQGLESAKGISISGDMDTGTYAAPSVTVKSEDQKGVRLTYPLIPRAPAQGERVFAFADIRWNQKTSEVVYFVVEPEISQYDADLIDKAKKILEDRLDVDFFRL